MNSENDLVSAGYVQTPEVAHTGFGDGKVFEKIIVTVQDNVEVSTRTYYVVFPDGSVKEWLPQVGVISTPSEVPEATIPDPIPVPEASESDVVPTPEATETTPEVETTPEASE